jgi:hypothetical protein
MVIKMATKPKYKYRIYSPIDDSFADSGWGFTKQGAKFWTQYHIVRERAQRLSNYYQKPMKLIKYELVESESEMFLPGDKDEK